MTRKLLLALSLALVAGCTDGPAKDFENICNAESLSGASSITTPSEKAMRMAKWIDENVKTDKARKTMAALAGAPPDVKGEILRKAAAEAGYKGPCPLAK